MHTMLILVLKIKIICVGNTDILRLVIRIVITVTGIALCLFLVNYTLVHVLIKNVLNTFLSILHGAYNLKNVLFCDN